jgi:hypothetical protein
MSSISASMEELPVRLLSHNTDRKTTAMAAVNREILILEGDIVNSVFVSYRAFEALRIWHVRLQRQKARHLNGINASGLK